MLLYVTGNKSFPGLLTRERRPTKEFSSRGARFIRARLYLILTRIREVKVITKLSLRNHRTWPANPRNHGPSVLFRIRRRIRLVANTSVHGKSGTPFSREKLRKTDKKWAIFCFRSSVFEKVEFGSLNLTEDAGKYCSVSCNIMRRLWEFDKRVNW